MYDLKRKSQKNAALFLFSQFSFVFKEFVV